MKHTSSIFALTAAALSFAVFLTAFQSEGRQEFGDPSGTATASDRGNGCRLRGPLLADIRGGIDILSRLHGVRYA